MTFDGIMLLHFIIGVKNHIYLSWVVSGYVVDAHQGFLQYIGTSSSVMLFNDDILIQTLENSVNLISKRYPFTTVTPLFYSHFLFSLTILLKLL